MEISGHDKLLTFLKIKAKDSILISKPKNFNFNLIWSWVEYNITLQSSDQSPTPTRKSRDDN